MQIIFNNKFEKYYLEFLKELVEHNEGTHYITDKKELKTGSRLFSKIHKRH